MRDTHQIRQRDRLLPLRWKPPSDDRGFDFFAGDPLRHLSRKCGLDGSELHQVRGCGWDQGGSSTSQRPQSRTYRAPVDRKMGICSGFGFGLNGERVRPCRGLSIWNQDSVGILHCHLVSDASYEEHRHDNVALSTQLVNIERIRCAHDLETLRITCVLEVVFDYL